MCPTLTQILILIPQHEYNIVIKAVRRDIVTKWQ